MARATGGTNTAKNNRSDSQSADTSQNGSSKNKNSKKETTLEELFKETLKDIYDAEKQLTVGLAEMANAAYSEDLEDAFSIHLEQTKRHVERLEKIFMRLDIDRSKQKKCFAMEGLIKENKEIISTYDKSPVRDAALIIGAQKVEHYEIAAYGSLRELADVLGYPKIAEILDRTLQEEEDTDEDLSSIAEFVNDEAFELCEDEKMAY